ncbi:hypothetical protein L773_08480, partial [Mycobacterium tuberculosis TRS16]
MPAIGHDPAASRTGATCSCTDHHDTARDAVGSALDGVATVAGARSSVAGHRRVGGDPPAPAVIGH